MFCTIGVEVLQLFASDADSGANGQLTFSLVGDSSLFEVSGDGRITTIAPGSSFNREQRDMHSLTVQAADGDSPSKTGALRVFTTRFCVEKLYSPSGSEREKNNAINDSRTVNKKNMQCQCQCE